MRFEILGPLRIHAGDGTEILVRSRNERTVLGVLLMRADQQVRADQLIEALWPHRPPASHVSNLQTYVSRLRDRLPGVTIEHANGRYRLPAGAGELDLLAFRREAAAGRAALERGEHAVAATRLRRALGYWRGRPLADLSVTLLEPEIALLETERLGAFEDRLDAESHGGGSPGPGTLADLSRLVREYPLRERLHGHLMVALCRAGRRADALAAYQHARDVLVTELGIEPGARLQRLHRAILRGDDPAPPGGTRAPGPAPPVFPVCQLPPPVAGFVGRAGTVERVAALVAPSAATVPVVVVSGQPGVGKSALAILVAHAVRRAFPDGQLFAGLGGAGGPPRAPEHVLAELLRALGVPAAGQPRDPAALSAAYRTRLADRRVLVVLDDVVDPAQVRALTPGTPGSAVLVTSRSRLSGLTDAVHAPLGPLTEAEAYALLERVVGADRVAGESRHAARIAAACGHLPLALRIAGTRLATRGLRLAALADRLDDERRRLTELSISDQQVRASLALSVAALGGPAREAFELLGVAGAVTLPSWAVAALTGRPDVDPLLDELVEANLLDPVHPDAGPGGGDGAGPGGGDGEPRYRLHDLLRVYAEELAGARPAGSLAALGRLLDTAVRLADTAVRRAPRTLAWSRPAGPVPAGPVTVPEGAAARVAADPSGWFAAERPLLVAAVAAAHAAGLDRGTALLAERIAPLLWVGGHWLDLDRVRRLAAESAARCGAERTRLLLTYLGGVLRLVSGDFDGAAAGFAASRAGFERLGDRHGLACVLSDQAVLHDYQDRADDAVRAATDAVTLFREAGDPVGVALASPGLSAALRGTGRIAEALAVDTAAVAGARSLTTPAGTPATPAGCEGPVAPIVLARCLNGLALSRLLGGDPAGGYAAATEAVRLLDAAGDRYVLLATLRHRALAAAGMGRRGEAVRLLERSHELAVALGDRLWATGLERDLAVSWIADGRAEAAVTVLHRCLRTFHEMSLRSGKAATLGALARAYHELGRPVAARAASRGADRLADPRDARTPALAAIVLGLADRPAGPAPPDPAQDLAECGVSGHAPAPEDL